MKKIAFVEGERSSRKIQVNIFYVAVSTTVE